MCELFELKPNDKVRIRFMNHCLKKGKVIKKVVQLYSYLIVTEENNKTV